jgi:ADP-heptose:LPS heptosyltransferase
VSICVLRALPGLGDLLCAVPALRALRAAHPGARIEVVGLPAAGLLTDRFAALVDAVVPFPGFPGIPEVPVDPARTVAFLAAAQREPADLALQLQGSGAVSNPFVALLAARRTAGFRLPGAWAPDEAAFLDWVEEEHEVRRGLRLLAHLGIAAAGEGVEFPLRPEDEAQAAELLPEGEAYAVVHVGATVPQRRWPPERFAAVAEALAARGLRPVLTGGAGERERVAGVRAAVRAPTLDLTGRTSLGAFAVVLRDARLVVTNDTGASHLAAAVRAPSVVLFLASDPRRWAPLDAERHRVVGGLGADPGVEEALAAVDAQLARRSAHPLPAGRG